MKRFFILVGCAAPALAADLSLTSPDQKLQVEVSLTEAGEPRYTVTREGTPVLRESKLGLVREDADFTRGLKLAGKAITSQVTDHYTISNAKRRENRYEANRGVLPLVDAEGRKMEIVFQVSNDGLGFRYRFPETDASVRKMESEATTFHFPDETRAWLQPMSVAKTGWAKTNPSYEEHYQMDIPAGTPSTLGAGWVYPALFRTGETWVLLSEAAPNRQYCNTRLAHESPGGEYGVAFPDPREVITGGVSHPQGKLPWVTPWRVVAVGSLKTITESMLGVDLADKPADGAKPATPGIASWSWPLLGDRSCNFETQKQFIDYAAEMGWRYTLIDALWDKQIGTPKLKQLLRHARSKNVEILLWYNSVGDWNEAPQTPKDRMLTQESRKKEFEWLKELGVAGIKVDFFAGDGQSVVNYQLDILEESAPYGLAINFHGTTLPRGLQRTYPHFMTAEAIKGQEFITFGQGNADQQPTHCTVIPFTRNVFDPMDFTPMVLDKLNDRVTRRTTAAYELALPVLFTSGIQHMAEVPTGLAKAPEYVKNFLKKLPESWDDSRLIDGFPGKYVVMARRSGKHWFVCGINGLDDPRKLQLDLSELGVSQGRIITNGSDSELGFSMQDVSVTENGGLPVEIAPKGGFVIVLQ